MIPTLDLLRHYGILSPLDDHFARTLGRIAGESRPEVLIAAALAARWVREAHVCLDLAALGNTVPRGEDDGDALTEYAFPEAGAWAAAVAASPLTRATTGVAPLVVEGTRVYLRRYHLHETEPRPGRAATGSTMKRTSCCRSRLSVSRSKRHAGLTKAARCAGAASPLRDHRRRPGTGKTGL
jgi:exodeoxyribonuclease V alpha subunit